MININEYDDEFDYNEQDTETYTYTIYYVTYYINDSNFLSPVEEYEDTDISEIPMDDTADDELYNSIRKIERKIDNDVANGQYKGLWIHRIDIPIESNYAQTAVDDWSGKTTIGEADIDSAEIDLPEDWTEDDDDFTYLADYAINRKNIVNESIMNIAVRKHFKERSTCTESLEVFQIGKRYPDFEMLEPFIIDYDVDLSDVEVGDILIRDWQYGHLPNTGYIPMEVVELMDDKCILVQTNDKTYCISNDKGISKDAMYHRLDGDFLSD